jgi:signal peptidase II
MRAWVAAAIGGILGGAVGNVLDRLRLGAVVDFIDVHVGIWHWPAFNVADSAISIAVAAIALDALFSAKE